MDYEKRYTNARIPHRYWALGLDEFRKASSDVRAAESTQFYVDSLNDYLSEGMGNLFVGHPGTGKTGLGCIILKAAISQGFSALFITLPNLQELQHKIHDLKDSWYVMKDGEAYQEWIRRTEAMESLRGEIQFVLIDDVGKEQQSRSGWNISLFDEILRTRYDRGLPTLLTSNLAIKAWGSEYSVAMRDFVYEACVLTPLEGGSLRRRLAGDGEG